MDLGKVLTVTFWAIIIASFPAIIWFFKVRKIMIRKQVSIIRAIESSLKPRDKRYWLLGYLVGFRAKYWVNRGGIKRAWVLYVTPPHHIFFYIPVIVLFKKRERLELTFELDGSYNMRGEAHLYNSAERSSARSVHKDIKDLRGFKRLEIPKGSIRYNIIYRGESTVLDNVKNILNLLEKHVEVYRISVDSSRRVIHVSFNPKNSPSVVEVISLLTDFIRSLRVRS